MPKALGHILPGTPANDNVTWLIGVVVDAVAATGADVHPAILLHSAYRFSYLVNHA